MHILTWTFAVHINVKIHVKHDAADFIMYKKNFV